MPLTTHTEPPGPTPRFAAREVVLLGHRRTYLTGLDRLAEVHADLRASNGMIGADIETYGLGIAALRIKAVSIATPNYAIVLDPRKPAEHHAIGELFDAATGIAFHHSMYDVIPLRLAGLAPDTMVDKLWDTLVMGKIVDADLQAGKFSLDQLAQRHLGLTGGGFTKMRLIAAGVKDKSEYFEKIDLDNGPYLVDAANDAVTTLLLVGKLYELLYERIMHARTAFPDSGVSSSAEAHALVERDQKVHRSMMRATLRGMAVDTEFAEDYLHGARGEAHEIVGMALEAEGLPLTAAAGRKLIALLAERGELPPRWPTTATGKPRATAADLELLGETNVLAAEVLKWQREEKLRGYIADTLAFAKITGRAQPRIHIGGARTGRMSISEPPLQQFPEHARPVLVADEGRTFTSIDYASQEPALAVNIGGDHDIAEHYEAGGDLYAPVVEAAGIDRKTAKTVLLAQLYGQGANSLAARLGVTAQEAYAVIDRVLGAMPGVRRMIRTIRWAGEAHGFVPTLAGRPVAIPRHPKTGELMSYVGVNYVIQGSAADCLYDAILRIEEAGLGEAIVLPVHDELVVDTEAADDIAAIMRQPHPALERWAGRRAVFRVDQTPLGRHWAKG